MQFDPDQARRKLHWRYRDKLLRLLDTPIPESCRYKPGACATFHDVIKRIMAVDDATQVYIAGGVVRDLVSGRDVTDADVDIKFTRMSRQRLKDIFDDMNLAMRVDAQKRYMYFFVGCDPRVQLEGSALDPAKGMPVESPANALMVDLRTMDLMDPTGHGVEDAKARVWRIPPDMDPEDWFTGEAAPRLLWRMIKFRLRGFTVPRQDILFIYRAFVRRMRAGQVPPSEYRTVLKHIPDPTDAVTTIVRDAAELASDLPREDLADIVDGLVGSGTVWKLTEGAGNVPFKTVCVEMRQKILEARAAEAALSKKTRTKARTKPKAKPKAKAKATERKNNKNKQKKRKTK